MLAIAKLHKGVGHACSSQVASKLATCVACKFVKARAHARTRSLMRHGKPALFLEEFGGWGCLAHEHSLTNIDLQLLTSCKVVNVRKGWQVEVARSKLQQAYDEDNADHLTKLLCSMVRAIISEDVCTHPLTDVTLRIALRRDECLPAAMSSCVRLARLLACKLDALSGLSLI